MLNNAGLRTVAAGGKYFRWGCGNGDQTILGGSGGMRKDPLNYDFW